jgi:hypothetical protein
MLTIRQEQFSALHDDQFARHMCDLMKQKFPKLLDDPNDHRTTKLKVQQGIQRARAHKLSLRSTITAYIVLYFIHGDRLDEKPQIKRALTNKDRSPDESLRRLVSDKRNRKLFKVNS